MIQRILNSKSFLAVLLAMTTGPLLYVKFPWPMTAARVPETWNEYFLRIYPRLPNRRILAFSRERSSRLSRATTRGAQSCVVKKAGLHWRSAQGTADESTERMVYTWLAAGTRLVVCLSVAREGESGLLAGVNR